MEGLGGCKSNMDQKLSAETWSRNAMALLRISAPMFHTMNGQQTNGVISALWVQRLACTWPCDDHARNECMCIINNSNY